MKKIILTDEEKANIFGLYMSGQTIRQICSIIDMKYSTVYSVLATRVDFKPRRHESKYAKIIEENIEKIKTLYLTHTKKEIAKALNIPQASFNRIVNLLKILPKKATSRCLDDYDEEVRELRETGFSYMEIAKRLRVSLCCVSAYCVDNGIETKSDSISKFYSYKEEMIKLRAEGKTLEEIALVFNCSPPTVHSILNGKIGAKRTKGLRSLSP